MPDVLGPKGNRIHYESHGSQGPCVVLLQGLGLAGAFWFDVPERLADCETAPQRVLVLDNRGTGRSDVPRLPFTMADMAEDVIAVMDAEDVSAAVICGISMGGMIAQQVALRHPGRVDGLVLMATTGGGRALVIPSPSAVATLLSVPMGRRGDARALARLVLPESQLDNARELMHGWGPAFRENPIRPLSFFAQLAAVSTHLTGARLGDIRCPTAVVTGDDDSLIPSGNSKALAARIPGAHLEVLKGVGHGVTIMDRDAVSRNVARVRGQRLAS